MRPRMIVVAGPPGSGKSSLFSPYRFGVDAFVAEDIDLATSVASAFSTARLTDCEMPFKSEDSDCAAWSLIVHHAICGSATLFSEFHKSCAWASTATAWQQNRKSAVELLI